jgi:hypothetical protein
MAISAPTPSAATDLVSMKHASGLFALCGKEYEVDPRTLKRWAVKHRVRTTRAGRDVIASWTDLLEVHAKEIDRREADRA